MFRPIILDRHKKKYKIEMYEGAGHAFLNNPQSKRSVNRDAAAKSVIRTAKWLKKSVGLRQTSKFEEVNRGE